MNGDSLLTWGDPEADGGQFVFDRFEVVGEEVLNVASVSIPDPGFIRDVAHLDDLIVMSVDSDKLIVVESNGLVQEITIPEPYFFGELYSFPAVSVAHPGAFAVVVEEPEATALVYRKTAISTTHYWAVEEVVFAGSDPDGEEAVDVELFDDEIWLSAISLYGYSFSTGETATQDFPVSGFDINGRAGDYMLFYASDWFAEATNAVVLDSVGQIVHSIVVEGESNQLALDFDGERYRLVAVTDTGQMLAYDLGTVAEPVASPEPEMIFDLADIGSVDDLWVYALAAGGGNVIVGVYDASDDSERALLVPKECVRVSPLPAPDSAVVNPEPFDVSGASGPGNTFDYPWCLAQIAGDAYCFDTSAARQSYIEDELIGYPEYGTIWIGRFDEEVVAP